MVLNKAKTQKEISVATQGIDNVFGDIGQKEKQIGIEFGRQSVEGVSENAKNAQKAIEHILEGEIVREDELRALVIKNQTVQTREVERSEQGGVITHSTQPEDLTVQGKDSITTPKADNQEISGTIDEFVQAFELKIGRDMLGRKSVISGGKAIPLGVELSEGRKITIEEFQKLIGTKLISESGDNVIKEIKGTSAGSI